MRFMKPTSNHMRCYVFNVELLSMTHCSKRALGRPLAVNACARAALHQCLPALALRMAGTFLPLSLATFFGDLGA